MLVCYLKSQYHVNSCNTVLAAILGQVLQRRRQVSPSIYTLFRKNQSVGFQLDDDEIFEALDTETTDFEKVFILIDALDELDQPVLLELERKLKQLLARSSKINLLLTSYLRSSWIIEPGNGRYWELVVPEDSIRNFVVASLETRAVISRVISQNSDAYPELIERLSSKAAGLVLLADIQLSFIESSKPQHRDQVLQLANNFSLTMRRVYQGLLEQVQNQGLYPKQDAELAIMWLAVAQRELPITLIKHARALADGSNAFLEQRSLVLNTESLLAACKGLVVFRETKGTITFTHPTAFQFFASKRDEILGQQSTSHARIARTILHQLKYLQMNVLSEWSPDCGKLIQLYTKYPLLEFMHTDLGRIYDEADTDFKVSFAALFSDDAEGTRVATMLWARIISSQETPALVWRPASVLHVAAALHIPTILQQAHRNGDDINVLDGQGYTPLRWAVVACARLSIRLLHELEANFAAKDNEGLTTLEWAVGCTRFLFDPPNCGHSVHGKAIMHVGNRVKFKSSNTQILTGCRTHPIFTEPDVLVMLVVLSATDDLYWLRQVLWSLACSKCLTRVVSALRGRDLTQPPTAILMTLESSLSHQRPGKLSTEALAESISSSPIRSDSTARRYGQISDHLQTSDDEWLPTLVIEGSKETLVYRARGTLSIAA